MKKDFLPKTLNGTTDTRACLNITRGRMSTEPHYHDCAEMIYVRRGSVRVFFDNGWHALSVGELLFVPPGAIHRCVSFHAETEQVVVGFTDELICAADAAKKNILCPYRTGTVSTGYIFSSASIGEKMERLYAMEGESDPSAQLSFCAEVLAVYGLLYSAWEREGLLQASRTFSPLVLAIRNYVEEHFAANISARDLSKHLNISYSYLSKLMTRELGSSLSAYIMARRIENAKKLLLSTEKSMAEIGYECGFASSSAFIHHFKELTGKTPRVFRSEALENTFDL